MFIQAKSDSSLAQKFREFTVKHGYTDGTVSKYMFGSPHDVEGFFRPEVGIVHLLSDVTSNWTIHHEGSGHNVLLAQNAISFYMGSMKHELLLGLLSFCRESNCKLGLPLPKNKSEYKDLRVEGSIEAISKLDQFSCGFNRNSLLTHEGFSDKVADSETNFDSRQIFESYEDENHAMAYHLEGMNIIETIEEKYGQAYVSWATGIALNIPLINPLDPEADIDSFFGENIHRPDERLRQLAEATDPPKCFPTKSMKYIKQFKEFAQQLFPYTLVDTMINIAKDDTELAREYRKLSLWLFEMISSVPYIGVDLKFFKTIKSKIFEDLDIWSGNFERLLPMMKYRKSKDFRVAWRNWENYLGMDVDKVLRNPDVLKGILKDKLFYGIGLKGEFFLRNPPIVIRDSGNCSVDLLTRPDITESDKERLLFKDFLEYLSALMLGTGARLSHDDLGNLRIPCYMGIEGNCCNPEKRCIARRALGCFDIDRDLILMCRPFGRNLVIGT